MASVHLGRVVSSIISEEQEIAATASHLNPRNKQQGSKRLLAERARDVLVLSNGLARDMDSLVFFSEYQAVLVRAVSYPCVVDSKRKQSFIIVQPDPLVLGDPGLSQARQRFKRQRVQSAA